MNNLDHYFKCYRCGQIGLWSLWWNKITGPGFYSVRMCPTCGENAGFLECKKGVKI